MPKRYYCMFKDCQCNQFHSNNSICNDCHHGAVWHSLNQPPPSDDYLSFVSPRLPARTPFYERKNLYVNIFLPSVPPLPSDSDEDMIFCEAIEVLPV